jgi:hypothetical protein
MFSFDRRESQLDAAASALGFKARPLASELIALEPRMVFDGAAAATAATVATSAEVEPTAWSIDLQGSSYYSFIRGDATQTWNQTLDTTPSFNGGASGAGVVRVYDRTAAGDILVGSSVTTPTNGTWVFSVTAGTYAAVDGSAGRPATLSEGRHNLIFKQQLTNQNESAGAGQYASVWVNVDLTGPAAAPAPVRLNDSMGSVLSAPYTLGMTTDDVAATLSFDLTSSWSSIYGTNSRIAIYTKDAATGVYSWVQNLTPAQTPTFAPFQPEPGRTQHKRDLLRFRRRRRRKSFSFGQHGSGNGLAPRGRNRICSQTRHQHAASDRWISSSGGSLSEQWQSAGAEQRRPDALAERPCIGNHLLQLRHLDRPDRKSHSPSDQGDRDRD